MNNTPKRHLWPLTRGHHKCRVQMTFLVSVSIKVKHRHVPDVITKKRESSSKPKRNTDKIHTHENYKHI